ERVIITYGAISSGIPDYFHWYQQKLRANSKLLIYADFYSHNSLRGSGSGTSYFLTISSMEAKDDATYYCQQKN
ncbi:hypothetical protein A6R68_02427, partial [Neotoma lepida]